MTSASRCCASAPKTCAGRATLRVRGGRPIGPGPPRHLREVATVPRMHKVVQAAIDARVDGLDVRYGRRGLPRRIDIDASRGSPTRSTASRPAACARDSVRQPVDRILLGDNLPLLRAEPDASVTLAYLDPPFNTGRDQTRRTLATTPRPARRPDRLRRPPLRQPAPAGVLLSRRVRRLPRLPRRRGCGRPGACSGPRARCTSTSTTARRTTASCCSTSCSAASASSTRSSGPTTTAPSRATAGRPSTTRSSSTSRTRGATCSTPRRSTASPTWRRASSRPSSGRAASAPATRGGTRSSPPPAGRRPATRRRSRRGSSAAWCRPPRGPATCASTPSPARARSARSPPRSGRRYLLMDVSPQAVGVMEERLQNARSASPSGVAGAAPA